MEDEIRKEDVKVTFFEPIEDEDSFNYDEERKRMSDLIDAYNANFCTFIRYEKPSDRFQRYWKALIKVFERSKDYAYGGMFRFKYDYFLERIALALQADDKPMSIEDIGVALLDDMKALDAYKAYRKEKGIREGTIKLYSSIEEYKKDQEKKREEGK